MNKRAREITKAAKRLGYKHVGHTGTAHLLFQNQKTGHKITVSASPKCIEHCIDNLKADIRRFNKQRKR